MPGAEVLIERYWKMRPASRQAARRPARRVASGLRALPMTDHASGLRAACEDLTADLRVYVDERMVTA